MPKLATLLLAILCVAFLAASCVTAAFWAGTTLGSESSAQMVVNLQSSHFAKMSVAAQTDKSLELTPRISTTSGLQILALQSGATNNAAQASNLLNNTTRIVVPISTAKNASNAGAQNSNRFTFPAWLWIWGPILILVIILTYLLLLLFREGNDEPPASNNRRTAEMQYSSETGRAQPRQIPIEGTETDAGLTDKSGSRAKDKKVRIPIETPDEPGKTEEKIG